MDCWRAVCRCFEQGLDRSDIDAAIKQMGRKAVPQSMEGELLLDPSRLERLMEQTADLPRRQRQPLATAGEQPALLSLHAGIVLGRARLPPLAQQLERFWREHHDAILLALGLLDTNDAKRGVDVLHFQLHDLADAKPGAVADAEQRADLQLARHHQKTLRLASAQNLGDLLRLLHVKDLGREIVPPHRHAQKKAHARHGAVAVLDGKAALHQMQLEQPYVLGRRRVGRALQIRRKPLARQDVAALRLPAETTRTHVFDHALAERRNAGRVRHGELLLSEVAKTSILKTELPARIQLCSQLVTALPDRALSR